MAHAAQKLAPPVEATPEAPVPAKSLSAALLEAQRLVGAVAKGSQNEYDKYAYTSSDTMIAACRDALHGAGLLFDREGWEIDRTVEPHELISLFVLEYPTTGERREYRVPWAIVGNPKRIYAVDKARAGALTTSIGYFLRDLLNVPRVDTNEMDRREDHDMEAPAARPTDASRTLQADIAAASGRLTNKRHLKDLSGYMSRAGHDVKMLQQLKGWVERRIAEQAAAPDAAAAEPKEATTRDSDEPALFDPETGEALDPESPDFGMERDHDGP
jgi:hypothetical protein